jgi:hypothetical protein
MRGERDEISFFHGLKRRVLFKEIRNAVTDRERLH